MSRTVVFAFDDLEGAAQAREQLRDLERRSRLALDDALILAKDAEGHVRRQRDLSSSPIIGAFIGAFMGVLLMFMFPIVGIVFGAVVGWLIGRFVIDRRVDGSIVADAEQGLMPGKSALAVLIRTAEGGLAELGSALRPVRAHIYLSTLAPQHATTLQEALGGPRAA